MHLRSGFRKSVVGALVITAAFVAVVQTTRSLPVVEPGLQVAKRGVVLDAQTRQPIAGAYVVARWLEQSRPQSFGASGATTGQCLFRTVVRTDAQGRYEIPASAQDFKIESARASGERKYFWDAYAYAPGYSVVDSGLSHPRLNSSAMPANQELQPMLLATADHAAPPQRVAALIDTSGRFTCEPYSPASNPVAQQVFAEAYAAACLPEPNDAARSLARLHESAKPMPDAQPCNHLRQASNVQ